MVELIYIPGVHSLSAAAKIKKSVSGSKKALIRKIIYRNTVEFRKKANFSSRWRGVSSEKDVNFKTLTAACQGLVSLHLFPGRCRCVGTPGHHHLQNLPTLYLHTSAPRHHPSPQGSSSVPCSRHWSQCLQRWEVIITIID